MSESGTDQKFNLKKVQLFRNSSIVCQPDTEIGSIFGRSAEHKIISRSLQCTICCDINLCNDHCGNTTDHSQTTQNNLIQTRVTTTTTTTTGRPTETTTEICHDHSNCDYLVQQLGICNDSYGLQMCPVACGKCIIPTTYSCIDTDTECSYLRDTYNICAVPDTARKTGCLKTCNYCDTKGNEFYLGFLTSHNQNGKLYLYIVSITDGSCQIFIPFLNMNSSFAISNVSINSYDISRTVFMDQHGIHRKAIHVKCNIPVSIYGLTFTGNEVDGFLALPSKSLGNKYIVSSFTPWTREIPFSNSNFGIIGIHQSTNVTIHFRIAGGSVTYNNIQYRNNDTLSIHLTQFDTFYLSSHYDFSGTLVAASNPVVVMSGVRTSYLRNGWGNHMEEMILPNEQLGRDFIVPKLYDSQCNFRIFAQEYSRVRINNNSLIQYIDIQRGRFHEFENYDIYTLQSSAPVQVQLYCNGVSSTADAFMVTLPSVQHFKNSYTYPVVNDFRRGHPPQLFYITVIIQSNARTGLRLDDKDIVKYEMITNITLASTLYSVITVEQSVGLHEIKQHNDIPFGLIVFGRNEYSGYGFPAGFAANINP
ncbi:IgGFc-binding protein-like [Mytilus edulis]|uniref:IgGFc-binding protein-like n=1 Tax=Mytilus edulis TaxID=6550 RepID=UPI0039F05BD4